jgi:hypothetical protein
MDKLLYDHQIVEPISGKLLLDRPWFITFIRSTDANSNML